MGKIKAMRKIINNFQSVGTRFFKGDIVIINNNDIYHVYRNKQDDSLISYHYENVDNPQIEKILDNSQDEE